MAGVLYTLYFILHTVEAAMAGVPDIGSALGQAGAGGELATRLIAG